MPGQFTGTRGQANVFIPALIREGFTNSEIVDFLRLNEFGYREQNMYADVNRIRLEQFGAEQIRGMDINTPIPERFMRTWEGKTDFAYRVVVQYSYTPTGGGEPVQTGTSLYYTEPPTVNEVLEDFAIRTQTLEGGFGSTVNVQRIDEIKEIDYFVNTAKGR